MKRSITVSEIYAGDFDEKAIIMYFSEIPYTAILDSALITKDTGRYTIIGFDPFLFFTSKGNKIKIIDCDQKYKKTYSPFEYLRGLLKKYEMPEQNDDLPFHGGCIGYFSYDLAEFIENIEQKSCDDLHVNDIELGFYNKVIIFDHIKHELIIVASTTGINNNSKIAANNNVQEIKKTLSYIAEYKQMWLEQIKAKQNNNEQKVRANNICSNFDKAAYMDIVQKAREHIRNGDIFQVNLSQRFEADIHKTPAELYFALRECSPAPFCAYLNFNDVKVLSSSPERFLMIKGRYIETRPIKGTRPRGTDKQSDDLMRNELLESEKERAELTMIVDLERNDLGRVCEFGSVKVQSHFVIEEYANVFHAVSTVTGTIKEGKDIIDCIYATFPGGSITGAPKIRAMGIIEEHEPVKRGIYTGAIGYIGFDRIADLSIAIRTIIIKGNKAYYNVGGGIVWDSVPEDEYYETLHKGTKMMEVLND